MEEKREQIINLLSQDFANKAEEFLSALNSINIKDIGDGNDLEIEIHPDIMSFTAFECTDNRGACEPIALDAFADLHLTHGLLEMLGSIDDLPPQFVSEMEGEILGKTIEWVKSVVRRSSLINKGFGIYVAIHDSTVESKV